MSAPTAYTHALDLQLGFIPAGYFPIGSTESLTALAQNHVKSGASQTSARFYELTGEPSFVHPQIDESAIAAKLQRLVRGEESLTVSTDELRRKAEPLTTQLGGFLKQARETFDGVAAGNKIEPTRLIGLLGLGQLAADQLKATGESLRSKAEAAFWPAKTDTYLRNEHGVFVSRAWLEDAGNAKFVTVVRFKQPAAEAKAAL